MNFIGLMKIKPTLEIGRMNFIGALTAIEVPQPPTLTPTNPFKQTSQNVKIVEKYL